MSNETGPWGRDGLMAVAAFPGAVGHIENAYGQKTIDFKAGMTLRDYFAAKALQGLLARRHMPVDEHAAADAYFMADAMLKARDMAEPQ